MKTPRAGRRASAECGHESFEGRTASGYEAMATSCGGDVIASSRVRVALQSAGYATVRPSRSVAELERVERAGSDAQAVEGCLETADRAGRSPRAEADERVEGTTVRAEGQLLAAPPVAPAGGRMEPERARPQREAVQVVGVALLEQHEQRAAGTAALQGRAWAVAGLGRQTGKGEACDGDDGPRRDETHEGPIGRVPAGGYPHEQAERGNAEWGGAGACGDGAAVERARAEHEQRQEESGPGADGTAARGGRVHDEGTERPSVEVRIAGAATGRARSAGHAIRVR